MCARCPGAISCNQVFVAAAITHSGAANDSLQPSQPIRCCCLTRCPGPHRYGLVRVRENAESIAFYRGEARELEVLRSSLGALVRNYGELLKSSRNLDFFTSFYRWGWWRLGLGLAYAGWCLLQVRCCGCCWHTGASWPHGLLPAPSGTTQTSTHSHTGIAGATLATGPGCRRYSCC